MDYAYVMTLMWPEGRGLSQGTVSGVYRPSAGETRNDAYLRIHRDACRDLGAPVARADVLHFSFEPNRLAPPAPPTTDLAGQQLPDER